jgi:predicted MPP superfamily phosphohydrolase
MHGALPHTHPAGAHAEAAAEAQQLAIPAVISGHTTAADRAAGRRRHRRARVPGDRGLAQRQGTTIFVSRGVGTVYLPIRINCPPKSPCSRSSRRWRAS